MLSSLASAAGPIALLGAVFWFVSAVTGAIGQGHLLTEWTDRNYAIWSGLTAFAVLCSYVALVATARRAWEGSTRASLAALAIGIVGVFLMVVGTWAWAATAIPLAIAFGIVLVRLRSAGAVRPAMWLLVAAWPVGAATLWLLHELQVGPQDTYGDYSVASVAGFAIAAALFGVGLASLGSWLRSESASDAPLEVAA